MTTVAVMWLSFLDLKQGSGRKNTLHGNRKGAKTLAIRLKGASVEAPFSLLPSNRPLPSAFLL
jgi:hypothetical protein